MGTIAKIHEMLVAKQVSCAELTKSYLDEIEKSNPELNAYVCVTPEEAMKTAKAVDKKIAAGESIGALEGVPMTLKDNMSTKGIETTCCSKILTGYKPIFDATVWEILREQNAVLLGKTNMDEFAMGSSCENSFSAVRRILSIPIMLPAVHREAFLLLSAAISPHTVWAPIREVPSASPRPSAALSVSNPLTVRCRATA